MKMTNVRIEGTVLSKMALAKVKDYLDIYQVPVSEEATGAEIRNSLVGILEGTEETPALVKKAFWFKESFGRNGLGEQVVVSLKPTGKLQDREESKPEDGDHSGDEGDERFEQDTNPTSKGTLDEVEVEKPKRKKSRKQRRRGSKKAKAEEDAKSEGK